MVVIKALLKRGGLIQWSYDTPEDCADFWQQLRDTGEAPDTGEKLENACYFFRDKVEPYASWNWKP